MGTIAHNSTLIYITIQFGHSCGHYLEASHTNAYTHACTYARVRTHTHAHTHTHTHTLHAYTHTYIHVYTHTNLCKITDQLVCVPGRSSQPAMLSSPPCSAVLLQHSAMRPLALYVGSREVVPPFSLPPSCRQYCH